MSDEFADKEYRDAFVEANLRNGIAFQIRAIRKRQGLSQRELGDKMGRPQNVISRIEDPSYGKLTLQTLLATAQALDVGLSVRFVAFSELANSVVDVSDDALAVPSFEEEALDQITRRRPSLIEEFSAPSLSNQIASSGGGRSSVAPINQSNIIDANPMILRRQREGGALIGSGEAISGALATFNQEHRVRAV